MRWKLSRCAPSASATTALITSPCVQANPQRVTLVQFGEAPVVLAHSGDGARLHLGEPLPVGEHRGAGLLLHHRPQRLLDQIADLAPGPRAVVDLGDPLIDHRVQAERRRQRIHGLAATQQRRAHDGADRQRAEPLDDGLRLLAALVVELDALGAAGQRVRGVRRRSAVPQQDHRHTADTTPVPSRIRTTAPSSTR